MSTLARILIVLIIKSGFMFSQKINTAEITVHIQNLNNNNGKLLVGLYDNDDNFLKKTFKGVVTKIENNKSTVTFKDVPEGVYAVSFVHDENDNGKMDTNFMGIPKEDYGCSNNAKGFMGAPKWKDAKFELKGESKTLTISL